MSITCHTDQAGIYGFRVHGISGDWVKGGSVYSYGVAESLRFVLRHWVFFLKTGMGAA